MKTVKIAQLKDRLSEHLREVERGGEVIVTDRDRPIARIVPMTSAGSVPVIIAPLRSFAELRLRHWKPSRWRLISSALLAEERREA